MAPGCRWRRDMRSRGWSSGRAGGDSTTRRPSRRQSRPGAPLGRAGASEETDPLGPCVQVQVHRTARMATWPPPRAVPPSARQVWSHLSPDPARLLGFTESPAAVPTVDDVVSVRRRHIARSQRNYYRTPMNLVRGRGVWFHDEDGLAYLDSLNNVTHVGHAEPRVTAAAARQMRKLNTNSRFVSRQIASYVQKLVATLPDPLEVVFLVCTGSEANDLALRIARQVTGRQHIVNIDGAYHGNTGVVTGISPNRYKGPGGAGAPATTHEVVIPDRYRSTYGYDDADAGVKYARDAAAVIERITADGRPPAAFIAESLMGSGGNIVFPDRGAGGARPPVRRFTRRVWHSAIPRPEPPEFEAGTGRLIYAMHCMSWLAKIWLLALTRFGIFFSLIEMVNFPTLHAVMFRIGALICAAPAGIVREILHRLPATRIPGVAEAVEGLVDVRGTLLTVLDGHVLLSQGPTGR